MHYNIMFGAIGSILLASVFAATLSLSYAQSQTAPDNINAGINPSGSLTKPAAQLNIPTNTSREQLTAPTVTPSQSGLTTTPTNPTSTVPNRATQLPSSPSPSTESPLIPRSGTIR